MNVTQGHDSRTVCESAPCGVLRDMRDPSARRLRTRPAEAFPVVREKRTTELSQLNGWALADCGYQNSATSIMRLVRRTRTCVTGLRT